MIPFVTPSRENPVTRPIPPTVPAVLALALMAAACSPTVKVEAPREPIVINLNVKIEHEVRVKVDKELDNLFAKESELF